MTLKTKLKQIYDKTDFIFLTVTFGIMTIFAYFGLILIYVTQLLKNNILVVYTAENIQKQNIPPYSTEKATEILININETITPYSILAYYLLVLTVISLIIAIYKFFQRRKLCQT